MWPATFIKTSGTIEGLQCMISFYGLKQYNLPLLQYTGGSHFNVHIFNCYAVEIEYPLHSIPSKKSGIQTENLMCSNVNLITKSKFETEILEVALNFNAYNNSDELWEVKIDNKNLEIKDLHQVLSKEAMGKLNIDKKVGYVDVGFVKNYWKIDLVEDNGIWSFGNGWNDFARESNLSEGDICIFNNTNKKNSLRVPIFKLKDISNWNPPKGDELNKSRTCFLHICNKDSLKKGEIVKNNTILSPLFLENGNCKLFSNENSYYLQVLPRMFMQKYERKLGNAVKLWMADRKVWITALCVKDKCMFGLQRLLNFYSIMPESMMVFEYFGESTFYLSILGPNGVDILYDQQNKLLLEEVVMESTVQNYMSVSDSTEVHEEGIHGDEHISSEDYDIVEESLPILSREENSENKTENFSVSLKNSHFDAKSHGVYIPRSLVNFYKKWRNQKTVTLSYQGKKCPIKGNAEGKRCRLGKGWSQFISKNEFVVGQSINFQYLPNKKIMFKVTTEI
ncbi:hypothetical protein POM88_046967 [Heracleum sosnowskyi]|uniref:TF-B3 domain-containing protein n=1 Tax=Heracleum sosnowskyi TaxID=360622 RepID=A0AAD8M809_9APIA|nr:hypothetical protein POM88_046967 [Heracleum sosnowskyi]